MEYQLDERTNDVHEMLESCQTRVRRNAVIFISTFKGISSQRTCADKWFLLEFFKPIHAYFV